LLFIILYSDVTIFNRFGKMSDHPVFLTLKNKPFQLTSK